MKSRRVRVKPGGTIRAKVRLALGRAAAFGGGGGGGGSGGGVLGRLAAGYQLAGEAEHLGSVAQLGGRGLPAGRYASSEQLVGAGAMVPPGDRVDAAESGTVKDQGAPVGLVAEHDVVRVLVLNDHVDHQPLRLDRKAPRQHPGQGTQEADLRGQRLEIDKRHRRSLFPPRRRSKGAAIER